VEAELEFVGPAILRPPMQAPNGSRVRGNVDRQAGPEGAEESQQGAMAKAGAASKGSAPQSQGYAQASRPGPFLRNSRNEAEKGARVDHRAEPILDLEDAGIAANLAGLAVEAAQLEHRPV
jgi:hypothetical protein